MYSASINVFVNMVLRNMILDMLLLRIEIIVKGHNRIEPANDEASPKIIALNGAYVRKMVIHTNVMGVLQ